MKIMKGGGKCQSLHHGVIATVTSHFTLLFLVNALKYTKFKGKLIDPDLKEANDIARRHYKGRCQQVFLVFII